MSALQWMTPSIGRSDPTWAKALVIDDGGELFCFVTIDAIGAHRDPTPGTAEHVQARRRACVCWRGRS